MKRISAQALILLAFGTALRASEPAEKLPLDKLLETPISTAAKYDQQLSTVAASVSVITAEEIERYGWSTVGEVLQSLRGFYTTYDRSNLYTGVRGIGRPTDYNDRILVLLDGIPLCDSIFGGMPVGSEMPFDFGAVEKIEVVRGPGSALYGNHAMLAVINLITKNADGMAGLSASVLRGSHQRQGATLRGGTVFGNGVRLTGSTIWEQSNGADLHFPELGGVARGLDYEDRYGFDLGLQAGNFRLNAYHGSRTKGVPTAMYGTQFDRDSSMSGGRSLVSAAYTRKLSANKSVELNGYWDRLSYLGRWQYDTIGIDEYVAMRASAEARFLWDIRPNHRLTAGIGHEQTPTNDYHVAAAGYEFNLNRPNGFTSYYVQYEGHPSPRFGFVAGIRHDDFQTTADGTSPRVALLFTPNRSTTIKLLHGKAFRSPNVYEDYFSRVELRAESVRTTELVWEQRLAPELFFVSSAFETNMADLIDHGTEPIDRIYPYENNSAILSRGAELALTVRRQNGLWAALSGTFVRATSDDGGTLQNAPRVLLKAHVSTSPWKCFHFGTETVYETSRRTRDGDSTAPFLVVNGIVSAEIAQHLRLSMTARNLLDAHYSNPVGPELLPQSIRQDGRTLVLKLRYER